MNRDRAGVEFQAAVGIRLIRQLFGQIAVLDHLEHAVADDEVPDFFHRSSLGDGFAAHLAAGDVVQAEEKRIDAVHQRIVDLKI